MWEQEAMSIQVGSLITSSALVSCLTATLKWQLIPMMIVSQRNLKFRFQKPFKVQMKQKAL
jgi:hypothetical protein